MKRFLIFVAATIAAWATASGDSSWFNPPPDFSGTNQEWHSVEHCVLEQEQEAIYLEQLTDQPMIRLGEGDAARICRPPAGREMSAYIVRALIIGRDDQGYDARVKGRDLWVNHESLASRHAETKRSAILVFTEVEVEQLYVTAFADE